MKKLIISGIIVLSGVFCQYILAQGEPPQEPPSRDAVEVEQTIKNWFYPHYINDQLAWEAKGEIATIIAQRVIKVKSLELTYHLRSPGPGGTSGAERLIKFKANGGIIKKEENLAIFKGNVSVRTHDNTELTTEEITGRFFPDKEELTISSDAVVTLTNQAQALIRGKGIRSENNLQTITWLKDIEVTLSGTGFSLFSSFTPTSFSEVKSESETPPDPDTKCQDKTPLQTRITCTGPFVIKEIPSARPGPDTLVSGSGVRGHKLSFKSNAELTRKFPTSPALPSGRRSGEPVPESKPGTGTGIAKSSHSLKELRLNSHLLEIVTLGENQGEIMVLKGKKRVVFYMSEESTIDNGDNKATRRPVRQANRLSITCQGNALIYPGFQRIVFQDRVQLTQRDKIMEKAQSVMNCDRLTIVLDPVHNEIKRVLAEYNISLLGKGGDHASAQQLKWHPMEHGLVLKSATAVKLWHQNSLLVADEIIIQTAAGKSGGLGDWEKIEARNRTDAGGAIKIAPPKKK